MVRFNLQLFAKKSVNAIAQEVIQGKWGNGATRQQKLTSAGYDYNTVQSKVNSLLGNNSSNKSTKSTKSTKTTTNKTTSNKSTKATSKSTTSNPTFDGAEQKYVDDAFEGYKPSEKENEYLANRDKYGQSMVDKINAGPQFSESVTQAFEWLEGQQDYFKNGKTSWDDKIFGQIDAIENREEFVYDVDNDQLFQQALASAMNSGKTAMQDTIGQASSLTGGYGSTYATSAGNQAYNAFIEDAYNNLPQYYQMALETYKAEGEEMYNLLGIYTQMGEQEWNRNVDAYNTVFNFADSQRKFEYGMYQDDITNTYNAMNMYGDFYEQENTKNLAIWQQSIDNAWKTIGQQSADYQFEKTFGLQEDQFEWNKYVDQQTINNNNASQSLKTKQYMVSTGDTNMDGVLSNDEKVAMGTHKYDAKGNLVAVKDNSTKLSNGASVTSMATYKQKALAAYNEGGDDAVDTYVESLGLDETERAEIGLYVYGGKDAAGNIVEGNGKLPLYMQTFTKTNDTTNWLGGVDNNDEVKDQNGKTWKLSELKKELKSEGVDSKIIDEILSGLTELGKDKTYTYSKK